MAEDWQVERAKELIGWPYPDTEPIRLALTAGDSESHDREGNRELAMVGDRMIPFIITVMCFRLGVSRHELSVTQSKLQDKKECARRARMCHLDTLVKTSVRQGDDGPQPTVLKNAMFALVAAVWLQAQDWGVTTSAMMSLGLVCRKNDMIDPRDLMVPEPATELLLDAVVPYVPKTAEQDPTTATAEGRGAINNASHGSEEGHLQDDYISIWPTVSDNFSLTHTVAAPSSIAENGHGIRNGSAVGMDGFLEPSGSFQGECIDTPYDEIRWSCMSGFDAAAYSGQTVLSESTANPEIDHMQEVQLTSPEPESFDSVYTPVSPPVNDSNTVAYDAALSNLSSKDREAAMQIVECIGTASAVFSLKLLVENLRQVESNQSGKQSATRIGAKWSNAERVTAIDDLALSFAHFTLPLRMHMYMLYKEAESEHPEVHDPFILEMGVLSAQPRGRGRPQNIRKSVISQDMMPAGRRLSQSKRWRRMGERLDVFVKRFGLGVLGILDEKLTSDMMFKLHDAVFAAVVDAIDGVEGQRVRQMCDRAATIVGMLFDGSDSSCASTFQIEGWGDSLFRDEERCSRVLAMLLLPCPEMERSADV